MLFKSNLSSIWVLINLAKFHDLCVTKLFYLSFDICSCGGFKDFYDSWNYVECSNS